MTIVKPKTQHTWRQTKSPPTKIPPLEPGDRLTRAEFERRYAAMPEKQKAELIEGVVHMPSPVRYTHGKQHAMILTWLGTYTAATPGVEFADNATVRLDAENEFQPDVILRLTAAAGGQTTISDDDYVAGAPELIVEVAASSASYDLHAKLPVYRRAGVKEYLVWQVYEQQFDWFFLQEGQYVTLAADEHGIVISRVFPGLHLHVAALLAEDLTAVLAECQAGLQTDAHAAFRQKLKANN